MTFRRLALNNILGSWQRYLAYFLSCVVSVATFYTFLSFIVSPTVRTGHIVRNGRAAVNSGLVGTEMVIVVFSFLFMVYSTAAFIRARKKEFGLLTLMGMTLRQIRATIFYELGLIALTALATGLMAGILFSKLFFMAMAAVLMLKHPIPYSVSVLAALITTTVFVAMFLCANVASLFGVRASSIRELLKAHHEPKLGPRRSLPKLILGVGLTAAGYRLAWVTTGLTFTRDSLPIVGLTVVGTYFLVTQGAAYACDWLRRLPAFYRRGTNLLVVNRLLFRLTDNARAIFVSAVLIAVVGSSLGAMNSVLQGAWQMALDDNAYALSLAPEPGTDPAELARAVDAQLVKLGLRDIRSQIATFVYAKLNYSGGSKRGSLASNSSYNRLQAMRPGQPGVTLQPGEAMLMSSIAPTEKWDGQKIRVTTDGRSVDVKIVRTTVRSWNPAMVGLVLNDSDYASLEAATTTRSTVVGFEYADWQSQRGVRDSVMQALGNPNGASSERAYGYQAYRDNAALTLFIGLFVASLFFLAAGSLIYFKLFTEIADDRAHYSILKDIGVTGHEVGRLVSHELAALFFVPVLIGAVHTAFALKTLSNLVRINLDVIGPGIMVGLIYLVAQTLYYLATRSGYMREVLR